MPSEFRIAVTLPLDDQDRIRAIAKDWGLPIATTARVLLVQAIGTVSEDEPGMGPNPFKAASRKIEQRIAREAARKAAGVQKRKSRSKGRARA